MEQTNVFIVDFSFKMYVEIDRCHKLYSISAVEHLYSPRKPLTSQMHH